MNEQTVVKITAENGANLMPFSHLVINQQFNGHHFFELRLNNEVIEDANSLIVDKAKDFLGKVITVSFRSDDGKYPENIFKGIIAEVGIANSSGDGGDIVFKGYSPTVLLETGKHLASYNDVTLADIVNKTLSGVASNLLSSTVNPVFKKVIPYLVQYNESNFEFVRRLAENYGEFLVYDGVTLYFGKPPAGTAFNLEYPVEITDLNFSMKVMPLNFELVEYDSESGKKFISTKPQINGLDSFGNFAKSSSNNLFNGKVKTLSHVKSTDNGDLNSIAQFKASAKASALAQITASSDFCFLKPASNINIGAILQHNGKKQDFGKYMVINITHSIDGLGNYSNTFDAIAASVDVAPNSSDKKPLAEPQLGVVSDNHDPDNLGRVKVQLLWQDAPTPWIRVVSLHSGGTNRGIFFLPEVGDYVMVGFSQNDPDRPFVMGSVPHGKNIDSSKNDDNSIKSIRTRTGSTLYFKDKDKSKEQEIIIKTDDQNIISITVENGKGTIKIASSKDIQISSDSSISIKSGNISIEASNKLELKAKDINIEAQNKLSEKGMDVAIEGSLSTKVKASATLEVDGGAMTTIKGGLVKIN